MFVIVVYICLKIDNIKPFEKEKAPKIKFGRQFYLERYRTVLPEKCMLTCLFRIGENHQFQHYRTILSVTFTLQCPLLRSKSNVVDKGILQQSRG